MFLNLQLESSLQRQIIFQSLACKIPYTESLLSFAAIHRASFFVPFRIFVAFNALVPWGKVDGSGYRKHCNGNGVLFLEKRDDKGFFLIDSREALFLRRVCAILNEKEKKGKSIRNVWRENKNLYFRSLQYNW